MTGLTPFNRNNFLRRNNKEDNFYNMIDDFFTSPFFTNRNLMNDSFKLDIKEQEDRYLVEADLPGIKKEEIDLSLNEGRLSISIQREEKEDKEEKDYVHRERRYTSMNRVVYLGDVKEENIKANLKDGVLFIDIPKGEEKEKTKKIQIE